MKFEEYRHIHTSICQKETTKFMKLNTHSLFSYVKAAFTIILTILLTGMCTDKHRYAHTHTYIHTFNEIISGNQVVVGTPEKKMHAHMQIKTQIVVHK